MDRHPVVVLDVNETLSDMSPLGERFAEVGAPAHLASLWFATVLRDGFALAASGTQQPFAAVAEADLRLALAPHDLDRPLPDAVEHVLAGLHALTVHDDVPAGLRTLRSAGLRVVTLSNGAASVADRLLADAGVRDLVERTLSVQDAGVWKPAADAYAYAAEVCGVDVADLVLVAVHPWDVAGAVRAGAAGAWVNRSGSEYPQVFAAPTVSGRSLPEVADAVAARS
ncbi:haloacid dehalogenase type II [uncultured Cellulomonas sp.]|uniref:haloacid dehalogenase type II n=1 Tax=uncultured Cellulomonas sp. TaxID=189682 RepID=UPI0026065DA3|nr:haloacid dehalogenase type II [uncultured Cellulomonas sp.]